MMKLLLATVNFLFASYAFAQTSDFTSMANTECANGSPVKIESTVARAYDISANLETLTISSDDNGTATTETFTLTVYGKNTYMAIPVSDESTAREFFVQVDESIDNVQVFAKDDGGVMCGGGLVVTQLQTFTVSPANPES